MHRSTEVSDALESDHMCVITQLDVTVTPPAPVYRVARNLLAVNRAAFNEDLQAELGNLTDPTADQPTRFCEQYRTSTSRPHDAWIVYKEALAVVQSSWL